MKQLNQIIEPVKSYVEDYHQQFREILSPQSKWLGEAIDHLSETSGKMIRPIMTSLMAGLYGLPIPEATIRAAVLLELIHTTSLIHDDVIDNSPQRRGRATLNAIFDNRVAVLMGDFILSSALTEVVQLENLRIISIVAGIGRELSEGEIRQFETADNVVLDEAVYLDVIRQKTASLFESCAEIAGVSVGTKEEEIQKLIRCGELFGLAFQIRDDIFDYADAGEIGKPTGLDILEGKITLPLLHSLLEDQGETEEGATCLKLVQAKDFTPEHIERLRLFAVERGGVDYAYQKMAELLGEAKAILSEFADSPCRQSLLDLADFIMKRKQ